MFCFSGENTVVLKALSDNSSIFFSLVLASVVFLQFDLSSSWCDNFLLKCVDVCVVESGSYLNLLSAGFLTPHQQRIEGSGSASLLPHGSRHVAPTQPPLTAKKRLLVAAALVWEFRLPM